MITSDLLSDKAKVIFLFNEQNKKNTAESGKNLIPDFNGNNAL